MKQWRTLESQQTWNAILILPLATSSVALGKSLICILFYKI